MESSNNTSANKEANEADSDTNNKANEAPGAEGYEGYNAYTERDLMVAQTRHTKPETGTLSPWQRNRSLKMKVFSFVLFVSFILIAVWQILVSNCQVARLCNLTDLSSQQITSYNFRTFRFAVPSGLVWVGLSIGSFMLFAASALTIRLRSHPISSKPLEFVGFYIRQASSIILLGQYLVIVIPSFIIFLIVGLNVSWSTAGSFSVGTMVCTTTAHIATGVCTRTNTRTNIKMTLTRKIISYYHSISRAFLSGAVILLSTMGLASVSISGSYLLYSDIQAVTGFIAGSSFASLFLRTFSTLSFDAIVTAFNFKPIFREVIPPNAVTVVSSGVSVITGISSDIFDSFAITTISTAFLGSGLPYFMNNKYALCIFNHLNIDKVCGPISYPEDISLASIICRPTSFYMEYPSLQTHTSVSRFVSAPLILLATTLVVYLLVMFCITIVEIARKKKNSESPPLLEPFKKKMMVGIMLCAALMVAASSAVFFGLFGSSTDFQTSELQGFGKNLPRMTLPDPNVCLKSSIQVLPTEIELVDGSYEPFFPSGSAHGTPKGVPMRLFGSHCIGILAGLAVALLSYLDMPLNNVRAATLGSQGRVFQRFSSSLFMQIPITAVIILTITLSYHCFGAYGVGLAALGYVSISSATLVGKLMGTILLNAESTEFSVDQDPSSGKFRSFVHELNQFTSMSAQLVTNSGTVLTVISALFAFVQKSGMWYSPRNLAGTIDLPASNLMYFRQGVRLFKGTVIVSTVVGTVAPILLGALFLTACFRSGLAIYVARRVTVYLSVAMSPSFVSKIVKISLQECVFLLLVCVMLPLCIGFGFGLHGLCGFLVALTSVTYVLGAILSGAPIKKRSVAPRGGDNLTYILKQNMGACIQASAKISVSLSLLMCTLMKIDGTNGWIGAVLFCVSLVIIIIAAIMGRVRFIKTVEASGLRDQAQRWAGPPRKVSPFYEDDSGVHPQNVHPSSSMADALRFFGVPAEPVSTAQIAVRDGSIWTLDLTQERNDEQETSEDTGAVIVPRPRVPIARGVLRDEARRGVVRDEGRASNAVNGADNN